MNQNARLTEAAYQGSALDVDEDFYGRIGKDTDNREIVDEFTVPIRSGQAWEVPAGHVCRITTVEGPQVGGPERLEPGGSAGRGCGLRGPVSSRPRTSPSSTGCGPRCPSCGRW